MNLVVVIIPAYRANATLPRTVASVKAQTMSVEIVVVDDGSPEPVPPMDGVRIIRQANAGGYAARLRGVAETTAPYVVFVDADDVIEPTLCEKMMKLAEAERLDVVQCETWRSDAEPPGGVEILAGREEVLRRYVRPVLVDGQGAATAWGKLYRRETCFGESFEPSTLMMYDDFAINLQAFRRVTRMGFLREGLYHYEVNSGSSVAQFKRSYIDDFEEAIRFRRKFLPEYGVAEGDPCFAAWIALNLRTHMRRASYAPCGSWRERLANVRELYRRIAGKVPALLAARVCAVILGVEVRCRCRMVGVFLCRCRG